jgi:polyhydroxybutyrate depolymerase
MLKNTSRLIILSICFLFAINVQAQYDSIVHDGLNRTYLLHLPQGYTSANEYPLIVAIHGGFGSATNLQNQSQLSIKADQEKFIVVYPEGVKGGILKIRTWNAGGCCGHAVTDNIDDVGFINSLLDTLMSSYQIDNSRVYATGMSNGAYLSYRLACELSHRIAAIAPVAGSMIVSSCNPTRPVPIIHIHSFKDSNVRYNGGVGSGVSNHYSPPLDSVLNVWSNFNSCNVNQDTVHNDNKYMRIVWDSCSCEVEQELYLSTDGGHSWHGGRKTIIGDSVSKHINANDLMWDFFKKHDLKCTPLSINRILVNELKVFPNPAFNLLKIELPKQSNNSILSLFDSRGVLLKQETISSELSIHRLDLRAISTGIYHLRLLGPNTTYSTTILKE